MLLTREELVDALQKEVRILQHLAGKLEHAQCDYRPTSKQRSALELLRYLSFMGPVVVSAAKKRQFDSDLWKAEHAAADNRDFAQTMTVIATLPDAYERLIGDMSDGDFRAEMTSFDGNKISSGLFIINWALGGHVAYRTQLFLYLKSCGHEHLNTTNLWRGVDAPVPS